jgi:hypothetical protein
MMPTTDSKAADSLPPVCRQTVDRLQGVLDGELHSSALDNDPHMLTCTACRERIAAAKRLLTVLSSRVESAPISPEMTERIVGAVLADFAAERRHRSRRRIFTFAGSMAIAAGLLVAIWLRWSGTPNQDVEPEKPEIVKILPAPVPTIAIAPSPHEASARPVRLGDEFAKAENALLGSSRPITDPAEVAPQMLLKLTDVLTQPSEPSREFEPARTSLLELPDAARNSLQPVTSTTQKAFARLLRDVSSVQLSTKPN